MQFGRYHENYATANKSQFYLHEEEQPQVGKKLFTFVELKQFRKVLHNFIQIKVSKIHFEN